MNLNKNYYLVVSIFIIFLLIEAFIPVGLSKINLEQNVKSLKDKDTVWIFNGKDLTNLKLVLENKNVDTGNLFNIKNKILYVKTKHIGYF